MRPAGFEVDVLTEAAGWRAALEDPEAACARVLRHAAAAEGRGGAVSVLLSGDEAIQALNRAFRGKDAPTNVLAFPADPMAKPLLGDLALALDTVLQEAAAAGKTPADHTAHLLVHGFLHLIGYDHGDDAEAVRMEAREREILAGLGVADPYAGR